MDGADGEGAPGQGTGLVEHHGLRFGQQLQIVAALHQNAALAGAADAAEKAEGHGDHQRAGAGDDQEDQRPVEPVRPDGAVQKAQRGPQGQQHRGDEEQRRGWLLTKTPLMAKSDLYTISGHWDHYLDGMFVMGDPSKSDTEEVYALRPMTCPFQYQAYLSKARSYRDLPLRYNETSTLFRNEDSGEMHGLIRVRQFTISEGHLMCTPDQLEDEFRHCLELAIYMLKTLGLYEDVSYRFSQWDPSDREKYIVTPEQWDEAQSVMKKILDHLEIPYKVGVGEAAFYGPKLDIQIRNVHGKEDTLITIQIDQMLSKNFGMEYTDRDGTKKNPYIIHRTSLGCYERTLALIIEKYAGAFPTWLAPIQVKVLPISEKFADYAAEINRTLVDRGIRSELDDRAEKIGYKIREAQLEKIPYMIVVGEKEQAEKTVSIRSRKEGDLGSMPLSAFIEKVEEQVRTKELNI